MERKERRYSVATLRNIASTKSFVRNATPSASWFKGDRVLWIIIAFLAIVSVLVVYSSTAKMAYDNAAIKSTSQFLQQQIGSILIGATFVLVVANFFRSQFFFGVAPTVYALALLLTFATYFLGQSTNGAARWLPLPGFQFQPSEALKVATVMLLARTLAVRQGSIHKMRILPTHNIFKWGLPSEKAVLKNGFVPIVLPILVSCGIVAPAHTSSALLIFGTSFVMLMIGRVSFRELGRLLTLVACIGALYMVIGAGRSDTAGGRVSTWVDIWTSDRSSLPPEDLADTERSMIAIYNGGLTGLGAGKSAMRVEMIHPESDYAFAFFIEEYGSLMAIAVLLLYLWIFFRAITICKQCGTTAPALLVLGLSLIITIQALLHIAVTINFCPETGQALPLISRGGSSLIFNAIALGMILSVSRQNEEMSHDMPRSQSIYEE